MNARQIIDRLAALDEATVAEPEVEPDVAPSEAPPAPSRPSRPARTPAPDPWGPPEWDPETVPGKAEDDSEAIEGWLNATQQPIRDWEWDGQMLRLLMQDGSTEGYTRDQLDEIGVFGQVAFAEGLEDLDDSGGDEEEEEEKSAGGEEPEDFGGDAGDSEPDNDEDGGLCGSEGAPCGDDQGVDITVQGILGTGQGQGGPAEQLTMAVDNLVQAILGVAMDQSNGDMAGPDPLVNDGNPSGELEMVSPDEREDASYDPEQLVKGEGEETEHTGDLEAAKKITKDHLDDDPESYDKSGQP